MQNNQIKIMSHHELLHFTINDPLTQKAAAPIIILTLLSFFTKTVFLFLMIVPSPELVIWSQLVSACLAILIGVVTITKWVINYFKKKKNVSGTKI